MFSLFNNEKSFFGGLKLPENKDISTQRPILKAPIPSRLVLPLQQHIGGAAIPTVETGERVFKGQLIARAEGYVSAPLHAATSGTVVAIGLFPTPHPSGLSGECIVIETDGEDQWAPDRQPPPDFRGMKPSTLRNHIREAGIVGMGGAAFPSAVKLNPGPDANIDTLILNGAECEPYITCDDMLMRERAAQVITGAEVLMSVLNVQRCLIGIEDNKPEAIAAMRAAVAGAEQHIEIRPVPSRYPEGGEKQLIQTLTGREVPADGLPLDIGIVLQNVATAVAIWRALVHGEPLLTRLMTVTGSGIAEPQVVEAMIGTPTTEIVSLCGGYTGDIERLVMGGPMMGFTIGNDRVPVVKSTNCILALTATDAAPDESEALPCIRCGACAEVCPSRLLPQQMAWHARARDFDRVQDHNLFDCIECGCCNLACPSHIPLVQYFRFAKSEIWAQEKETVKADIARERHDARQERLDREAAEKAERLARKKASSGSPQDDTAAKQAAIAAALAKSKAKRSAQQSADSATPESSDSAAAKPSAAQAAIAAAKARAAGQENAEPSSAEAPEKSAAQLAIERAKAKSGATAEAPPKSAAQLTIEKARAKSAPSQDSATEPAAPVAKSAAQLAIEKARAKSAGTDQPKTPVPAETAPKSAAQLAIERARAAANNKSDND